jgi:hypothetical protein
MRPRGSDVRKIHVLMNGAKHGMFGKLEHVVRILSEVVLRGRRDLADPGDQRTSGPVAAELGWRTTTAVSRGRRTA